MSILAQPTDTRVADVEVTDTELVVRLMDGRTISVPLAWFPRLEAGSVTARQRVEIAGAGYGLHWPELDEDLSVEGLLRGAREVNAEAAE